MTRILGLDPGLSATGWGLFDMSDGSEVQLRWGTLRPPRGTLPSRLTWIQQSVSALIERHRPDAVAIERPFINKNVKTAVMLGQAQAAAMIASASAQVEVHEYPPRAVKQAVSGLGDAEKSAVKQALEARLGLGELDASPDAADALAVAYCHYLLHAETALMELT